MPIHSFSTTQFECRRDDLTIRGTEYRPEGEKLPIAIVSHGFMACQDTVRDYAIKLAEAGYCAYCFDFCGGSVANGKSDGATTDMTVLTEVSDLKAVIGYTRALPYTSDDGVLLMGCSQGGLVSAITAAQMQDEVSKLALFYPAFCIPDDARSGSLMMSDFDPHNIPDTFYCGPMKLGRCYPDAVMDMDPFEVTSAYHGKVLIVHGTSDDIVDISYAIRAHEAYNAACPDTAELLVIDGGGHGFNEKDDAAAIEKLLQFAAI